MCDDAARTILRAAIEACRRRWPFEIDAAVLLPDHLHQVWTLPADDADFSRRWAFIKRAFSAEWVAAGGAERTVTANQWRNRRGGIWQPRFWEHAIRDADDLNNHLDYVHYNPVKHGAATCPHAWKYSSFHRWVDRRRGYDRQWCCACDGHHPAPPSFQLTVAYEPE